MDLYCVVLENIQPTTRKVNGNAKREESFKKKYETKMEFP